MELSGFRVSIHSDGEGFKEYSVEISPDGKKATCWVPSRSGKNFVVEYEVGESSAIKHRAKSVQVFMDGYCMGIYFSLPHETKWAVEAVPTSDDKMRPFVFADIRTTDEDTALGDTRVSPDNMGTTCVQVFLAKSWQRCNDGSSSSYKIQDHPPVTMNERTKKVLEHCVSLGDEQPSEPSDHYIVHNSKKPDLVFEFRYRPPPMLQALDIIPPPKREDEDALPPPKRRKVVQNDDLVQSMKMELDRLRERVNELEGKRASSSGVKKEVIKDDPDDITDLT